MSLIYLACFFFDTEQGKTSRNTMHMDATLIRTGCAYGVMATTVRGLTDVQHVREK